MTERTGNLAADRSAAAIEYLTGSWLPKQDTIQAIIPWEAEGRVFQVDTGTMMFLGAMHGIMYVQSSRGEIHEAFVMCPVTQKLDIESGDTEATARCEITASADDVAYAELSCEGKSVTAMARSTLIDGEGKFAGISGSARSACDHH